MEELALLLLLWIGQHSGYDTTDIKPPEIIFVSLEKLIAVEVYLPQTEILILETDFDQTNLEDRSTLLHGLVHHVQHVSGTDSRNKRGALERDAYKLEAKWRRAHSLPVDDIMFVTAEGFIPPHQRLK